MSVSKIAALALLATATATQAAVIPSSLQSRDDGPSPTRDCLSQFKPGFDDDDVRIADDCYKSTIAFMNAPNSGPIKNIAGLFALVPICGLGALEITVGAATCAATSAMHLFGKVIDKVPNHEHLPHLTIDNDPTPTPAVTAAPGATATPRRRNAIIARDDDATASCADAVCQGQDTVIVTADWFQQFANPDGSITGQSIVDYLQQSSNDGAAFSKSILGLFPADQEISKATIVDALNNQLD